MPSNGDNNGPSEKVNREATFSISAEDGILAREFAIWVNVKLTTYRAARTARLLA